MLKPQDKAKSVGRNSFVLVGAQFSGLVVAFLVTPFIIHSLGVRTFGLWVFVGSIVAFVGLLNLSLGRGTMRFVAVFGERGDSETIRRILSYGMVSHLVFGLAVAPLAWVLAGLVIPHTTVAPEDVDLARNVFFLVYLVGVLGSTVRPLASVLVGLERVWMMSLFSIISQAAYGASIVVFLLLGAGIYGLVASSFISIALVGVLYYIGVRRVLGRVFANPLRLDRKVLREMLVFGGWTQALAFTGLVNMETDAFVIGTWVSVTNVGYYDIANRIALQSRTIPLAILPPLLPASAGVYALGDHERLSRMSLQASRVVGLLSVGAGALIIATIPLITTLWLGHTYPDVEPIAILLTVTYTINNLTGVGTTVVSAIGKPRYEVEYGVLATVLNIVGTLALAPFFGLYGILIATAVAVTSTSIWFLFRFHRLMAMPMWEYVGSWLWRLVVAAGIAAGVVHLAAVALPEDFTSGRAGAFVALAAASIAFGVVFLLVLRVVRFFGPQDLRVIERVLPVRMRLLTHRPAIEYLFGAR